MANASISRSVGGTECSWCKAARGGTGIAVLALLISKPLDIPRLQNALHKLQNSHPILKSRLIHTSNAAFSFVSSPTPFVKIESHGAVETSNILIGDDTVSPLHRILEHELNQNTWRGSKNDQPSDMFEASIYATAGSKSVVALRLHVAACDRTTAVSLLRELPALIAEEGEGEYKEGEGCGLSLGIEDLVPAGKFKKPMWARGIDVLSYSVNSFRLTNLKFHDTKARRFSQLVRLQLNQSDTKRVLEGCKLSRIKLCGAVTAAGLMAAHSTKNSSKKYGVITLTDCRSSLQPPLSPHHFGFYHSAILNTHVMKGGESLWELAKRTYGAFASSKSSNKHLSDMADMNFLMCKAIDNPGLTSSSSLRTSILSVFEDTVVDESGAVQGDVGLDDYMGCASVHGVGPSLAVFDTIRDGKLDCVCVYPAPLHSREQMLDLVSKMKALLIEAGKTCEA